MILLVIAFAGLSQSTPERRCDGGAAIKAFYVDHSSRQEAAAYLVALAVPFLIFFASRRARDADRVGPAAASTIWHNIFLGGALVAAAGFLGLGRAPRSR